MATDRLRVASNERVDIDDFRFIAGEGVHANLRQLSTSFLMEDAVIGSTDKTTGYILSGFAMSSPGANQLQVTKGTAILSQRLNGAVYRGVVTTEGDASIILDLSSYAAGTYGIYIRFEETEGSSQGRIFWNPTGTGSEYVDSVPTRYVAKWALRVEAGSPGEEWLKIGQTNETATSITDQRSFYFEGTPTTYLSGWSTDGGGSASDRNASRDQYGVGDLHTFIRAMKQCMEDIKGRGLKRWWDRDIGGMNIGFDADPTSGRLAIGDANYYLELVSSDPRISFQTNSYLRFQRSVNEMLLVIDSTNAHVWSKEAYYTKTITADASTATATNVNAITATGKGSGIAFVGQGGSSDGHGGTFTGGANGIGCVGFADGQDVSDLTSAMYAVGVVGLGASSGTSGGYFLGGANAGVGCEGVGGTNGKGGKFTGNGAGHGVELEGGADAAPLYLVPRAAPTSGLTEGIYYSDSAGNLLGYIEGLASSALRYVGCQAWVSIETSGGPPHSASIEMNLGITSVAIQASKAIRIIFNTSFTDNTYVVLANNVGSTAGYYCEVFDRTGGYADIKIFDSGGSVVDPALTFVKICVAFFGH